jgi:7-cyano-7-deazaguanine synthase in queuosine biosynthesis
LDSAVISFSGGFDSIALAAIYKSRGVKLYGINIDYGQTNQSTVSAKNFDFLLEDFKVVKFTHPTINKLEIIDTIPNTLSPSTRMFDGSMTYRFIPAAYAYSLGISDVINGLTLKPIIEHGRTVRIGNSIINIHYPYVDEFKNNKARLGVEAIKSGLITKEQLSVTTSCVFSPPCGECAMCLTRKTFFESIIAREDVI